MAGHEQFEELAAGHALHALEPGDEQIFLEHLAGCASCQRTLAEFSEVAAGLALSSAEQPQPELPPQVWQSIGAEIGRAENVEDLDARRRAKTRMTWLGVAAAAALIAGALVGVHVVRSGSSSGSVQAAVSTCRHTSGCQLIRLSSPSHEDESAYLMVTGEQVQVATASLPVIDATQQSYVLWQEPRSGRPVGVVAFAVTTKDKPTVVGAALPQAYDDTAGFAISRETGTTIPPQPSNVVVNGPTPSA